MFKRLLNEGVNPRDACQGFSLSVSCRVSLNTETVQGEAGAGPFDEELVIFNCVIACFAVVESMSLPKRSWLWLYWRNH